MGILVVNTNRNRLPLPVIPVGACMAAESAAETGHEVRFLDLTFEDDPLRKVYDETSLYRPDLIGLSIRNIDNHNIQSPISFAGELKALMKIVRTESAAPVIIGGSAVCVMPEELLRLTGADWAATGDGETTFPLLIEKLSRGEGAGGVPGLAWLESGEFRTTPQGGSFPRGCWAPDYFRWIRPERYVGRMASVPLQTKLGCHFKCVYCTYRKVEDGPYRIGEPTQVSEVIASLAGRGFRSFEFVDNVFNYPYQHALAVCETIAALKLKVALQSVELSPRHLDTALLNAMERAGFSGIGITAESASDRVLGALGKDFDSGDVRRAAEVVRKGKIPCLWIFMLGGPGETRETFTETLEFAERCIRKSDAAFFGIGVRVYPGTKLEEIARSQGVLNISRMEMLEPVFYISPEVGLEWMNRTLTEAMGRNMNFISHDSLAYPLLPSIQRLAFRLGVRPPLWKYARHIRRGLRMFGLEA